MKNTVKFVIFAQRFAVFFYICAIKTLTKNLEMREKILYNNSRCLGINYLALNTRSIFSWNRFIPKVFVTLPS